MRLCHAITMLFLAFGASASPAYAQSERYSAPDEAYARKDFSTAHSLWLAIAEEGNASAYFNLGRMYLFGEGVPIDFVEAYKWFALADKAGQPQAKAGLTRVSPTMTASDVEEANRRIERWYDAHPSTRR